MSIHIWSTVDEPDVIFKSHVLRPIYEKLIIKWLSNKSSDIGSNVHQSFQELWKNTMPATRHPILIALDVGVIPTDFAIMSFGWDWCPQFLEIPIHNSSLPSLKPTYYTSTLKMLSKFRPNLPRLWIRWIVFFQISKNHWDHETLGIMKPYEHVFKQHYQQLGSFGDYFPHNVCIYIYTHTLSPVIKHGSGKKTLFTIYRWFSQL